MEGSRFDAEITLDKDALVFFSVPYSDNWKAEINGEEAEIVKADGGMMAVLCRNGKSSITFRYRNPCLIYGMIMTAAAAALLVGYIILMKIKTYKQDENK